jgi:hypothetical protein
MKGANEMKKAMFKKNLQIMLLGILSALKGTLATALVAAAVLVFRRVLTAGGYLAIVLFVAGIAEVCLALLLFYFCGRDMLKGKFSK